MKLPNILIFALLGLFITVVACNSNKEEQPATDQSVVSPDQSAVNGDPNSVTATPSTGNPNEPHYKCPKNCEGGVGSAKGKCPICDTEMVHNPAFHAQIPSEPGSSPQTPITVNPKNAENPTTTTLSAQPTTVQPGGTPQATMKPEPPQNAKGDWHFACSKSCGGGAGAAGNCPKCGSPLAHNQAYHAK